MLTRREQILSLASAGTVFALFAVSASAQSDIAAGKLIYRGFTVDISAVQNSSNFTAIESSVKHQIDIVADCGVKPEILSFLRSRLVTLNPKIDGDNGEFSTNGVEIGSAPQAPEKPILLHELLHAFHALVLPSGFQNPDIVLYYHRAKDNRLYPATEYLLTNPMEFFAVTGSLYLWGHVSRVPFTRENLEKAQPLYYAYLGQLFGVQK